MTTQFATLKDSELIQLTLAGDNDCFTALIDRHLQAVKRRITLIARRGIDVDDLLQETLLKVWRHLSTFRSEATFRTWMTRVAINELLQSHRRSGVRPHYEVFSTLDRIASPQESPLELLTRVETSETVRGAIALLPTKYRQVVIHRDFEQLSIKETARSLAATIPAIKIRLFRARRMLATVLNDGECRGRRRDA